MHLLRPPHVMRVKLGCSSLEPLRTTGREVHAGRGRPRGSAAGRAKAYVAWSGPRESAKIGPEWTRLGTEARDRRTAGFRREQH